jgi:hypothetical protein
MPEDAKASEDGSPVVAKICEHPCAGELASIAVFRDAQGAVGRYRFDGDLQVCSHPPRIYYDERGRNVLGVAHRPVEKDEAEAIAQRQADAVAGFTEAETLRCPTKPEKAD